MVVLDLPSQQLYAQERIFQHERTFVNAAMSSLWLNVQERGWYIIASLRSWIGRIIAVITTIICRAHGIYGTSSTAPSNASYMKTSIPYDEHTPVGYFLCEKCANIGAV